MLWGASSKGREAAVTTQSLLTQDTESPGAAPHNKKGLNKSVHVVESVQGGDIGAPSWKSLLSLLLLHHHHRCNREEKAETKEIPHRWLRKVSSKM